MGGTIELGKMDELDDFKAKVGDFKEEVRRFMVGLNKPYVEPPPPPVLPVAQVLRTNL